MGGTDQIAKIGVVVKLHADRQDIDEEADQAFGFHAFAPGNAHADDHIGLARQAIEHGGKQRQTNR